MLTSSDRVSRGVVEDTSGDLLEELLRGEGFEVERRVVPDEREQITAATLSGGISSPGAILSKPTEDPSPIRAVLIGSILIKRTQPI